MKNYPALEDFRQHLIAAGKSKSTVRHYVYTVEQFLAHVGNERPERISEAQAASFFAGCRELIESKHNVHSANR